MRDEHTTARQLDNIGLLLGPLAPGLSEPGVLEVMLNSDGCIWHDVAGEGLCDTGRRMTPTAALTLIGAIARYHGREVTARQPKVECELPSDGSRFTALIPPVAPAPVITLRRHASMVFALDDYASSGIATQEQVDVIRRAVHDRRTILVAGATGSGKSTLLNAIIAEISVHEPNARLVLLEDTYELQCQARNVVRLHTQPGIMSMRDLVACTMRLRPDRIIVGEVREGPEAREMIKVMGTGHPGGASTTHADSGRGALLRLEHLIGDVQAYPAGHAIAQAIDVVVSIQRDGSHAAGRRITEIVEVEGYDGKDYQLKALA